MDFKFSTLVTVAGLYRSVYLKRRSANPGVAIPKFVYGLMEGSERISESWATPEPIDSSVLFELEVREAADPIEVANSNSAH